MSARKERARFQTARHVSEALACLRHLNGSRRNHAANEAGGCLAHPATRTCGGHGTVDHRCDQRTSTRRTRLGTIWIRVESSLKPPSPEAGYQLLALASGFRIPVSAHPDLICGCSAMTKPGGWSVDKHARAQCRFDDGALQKHHRAIPK